MCALHFGAAQCIAHMHAGPHTLPALTGQHGKLFLCLQLSKMNCSEHAVCVQDVLVHSACQCAHLQYKTRHPHAPPRMYKLYQTLAAKGTSPAPQTWTQGIAPVRTNQQAKGHLHVHSNHIQQVACIHYTRRSTHHVVWISYASFQQPRPSL